MVKAPVCGTGIRGFKSHHLAQFYIFSALNAVLVRFAGAGILVWKEVCATFCATLYYLWGMLIVNVLGEQYYRNSGRYDMVNSQFL